MAESKTKKDTALADRIAAVPAKALSELILNLAGFYWETGEKEKSIQIAQKGLKKATGWMDELRAFVAERAQE